MHISVQRPIPCRALALAALLGMSATAALADAAVFETPEAATEAVIAALEARDRTALIEIFGPENEDVILSGDDPADREAWGEFLADYRTLHRLAVDDGVATLYVGRDQWPFPAPLVESAAGWQLRRRGRARGGAAAAHRRERARRDRADARLRAGAGRLPRQRPGRRRAPDLRGRRPQQPRHARRALLARRAGHAREPGRRLHGAGGGRRLQRRRRGRRSRPVSTATTSACCRSRARTRRAGRSTTW